MHTTTAALTILRQSALKERIIRTSKSSLPQIVWYVTILPNNYCYEYGGISLGLWPPKLPAVDFRFSSEYSERASQSERVPQSQTFLSLR